MFHLHRLSIICWPTLQFRFLGITPSILGCFNRCIANSFVAEVEEARGSTADTACKAKTKLVEAKLEMVRPAGLFHYGFGVSRVHWINPSDRLQRDEIDGRLQGGLGPRQGGPGGDQSSRFTYQGGISSFGKHKRERRGR